MATKRSAAEVGAAEDSDQDPDYAMVTSMHPLKKQKVHQQDAKETTVKKIEGIIRKHFALEIRNKEKEIELADERIHQVRSMLDKLRACVVANYYGNAGVYPGTENPKQKMDLNHPAIQRALGNGDESKQGSEPKEGLLSEIGRRKSTEESTDVQVPLEVQNDDPITQPASSSFGQGSSRFHVKKRIIVGNVSKYITIDNREESDPSTHKWMVYVRGPPDEPRIDHFVKKVWFYLHPSYRPNDLVEVKDPPFHLTRRGWGEFPIRVQLHFNDSRSKKVDIIHHLKLDRTYTGLQTLGAETIVDVELDRYLFDERGLPGSRPSTPTVTKVNYREGYKAGLSRTPPSLRSSPSVFSTKSSSPLNSDDQHSTPASSPLSGSRETPVMPEESQGASSGRTTPSPSLSNKVQIQSGVIVSSSTSHNAEGEFVKVLPSATSAPPTTTKSDRSLQGLPKLSLSSGLAPGLGVKKAADGKGALSWRIEEGKLLEMPQEKGAPSPRTTMTASLPPPLQATPSASTSLAKPRAKLPSLKVIGPSSTKASTSTGSQMTLLGRQTVKSLLGTQKPPTAGTAGGVQVVSGAPGGQYYITAKSTDPNLQGKVILIPHQVFAQAQAPGGGKTTTAKSTTKTLGKGGKSSFLSPSNVLILPQGSIVPPLPPGSIVQIQQVPSPARTAPNQAKPKTMTNLIRTGITSAKGAIPVVSTSGGSKQAKIIQSVSGAKSPGVSLIPDIKSQLSRTPSGGVILVQRMPTKIANTQVGGAGMQKVTMTQRQQQSPLGTVQGQAKQNILLQSPASPPPTPLVPKAGKVSHSTTTAQPTKRVMTEPAQTLPVPEGTVEITRTLTETVSDRKTPMNQADVIKARNTSTTSYARLPGLSPIKPPGASAASKAPPKAVVTKPSGAPPVSIKQHTAPAVSVKTTNAPVSSSCDSTGVVVSNPPGSLSSNDSGSTATVSIPPPNAPLPTTDVPPVTTKPAEKPLVVPPVPPVTAPVASTDPGKAGDDQSQGLVERPVREKEAPSTDRQLATAGDREEGVAIKSEPVDPDIETSVVTPLLTSDLLSDIGSSLVVAATRKSSQDEVLKVAVEPVRKEPSGPDLSGSGGLPKLAEPVVSPLADSTGGDSSTKPTSPLLGASPACLAPTAGSEPPETSSDPLATASGALTESASLEQNCAESIAPSDAPVTAAGSSVESQAPSESVALSSKPAAGVESSMSSSSSDQASSAAMKQEGGGEAEAHDGAGVESSEKVVEHIGPGMLSAERVVASTDIGESQSDSTAESELLAPSTIEPRLVPSAAETGGTETSSSKLQTRPTLALPTSSASSPAGPPQVGVTPTESMTQVQSPSALAEQCTSQASSSVSESQRKSSATNQSSSSQAGALETGASSIDSEERDIHSNSQLSMPGEESIGSGVPSEAIPPGVDSTCSSTPLGPKSGPSPTTAAAPVGLPATPLTSKTHGPCNKEDTSHNVDETKAGQPQTQVISESISALVCNIKKEPLTELSGNAQLLGQLPSTSMDSVPSRARTYLDQPGLLKWCAKLNMKRSEHISLYRVETMEQLIRRIVRVKPLFVGDRNIEELPYSATSLHGFQLWPVGKRRAAEWQRALDVRRMAHRQIHKVVPLWNEKVWSTKRIMKWCRQRGYTPGDTDLHHAQAVLCNQCGSAYHVSPSESHTCQTRLLSDVGYLREPTYSIPDDWCQSLKAVQKTKEKDLEEVVIIDVVTTSPDKRGTGPKMEVKEEGVKAEIPPTPGALVVVEEANKLGIHFKSHEAAEGVLAPVVQEMIFTATKQFLADLLHLSHQQTYDSQTKGSSVRVPAEIHPVHIHQAIRSTGHLDFLTNQRIGVLNEIPGSSEDND